MPGERLAATMLPLLGPGWSSGGQPLTSHDVHLCLAQISSVLQGLDQIELTWPVWHPGPSARCLIPRATALAALWDTHPPV